MELRSLLKNTPEYLLWLFALLLLFTSFVLERFYGDSTLDINIGDTYYVISHYFVFAFLGFWFVFCGFGYWVLGKFKIPLFLWLTTTHLILSLLGILHLVFEFSFVNLENLPKRYYQNTSFREGTFLFLKFFLLPLAQLFYLANLLSAILLKIFRKNKYLNF